MTEPANRKYSPGPCPSPSELNEYAALDPQSAVTTVENTTKRHIDECEQCREWVKNARFEQEFAAAVNTRVFAHDPLELLLPELPGYEIVREVSRGGQGIVYEAVQVRTRRRVALKILRQDHGLRRAQRARFEREIEIAAALHHPGIVAVYDSIALPAGRHALVLEFVEGRPLDQLFALSGNRGTAGKGGEPDSADVQRAVELLGQVCEAIHYAHQRGVIHRDLKPSNILVDAVGKPRILDFGVACWFGASATEPVRITITGEFAGTLAYAAPEQVSGARGVLDLRSDLYAIGVMLYQLCLNDLPYDVRGSLDTVIKNIASAVPAPPVRGKLDEDLWIIISKALAKEPDRRYQSGEAMASDLRRYLRGETIEARRDSRLYVMRKAISRHRYSAAGVCLAMAGLAFFGATLKSNNTQLVEALRISNIERARAIGAAGSRAEAEAILRPEILRFESALKTPEQSIFDGTPEERRALWAGVEMQAAQPCLGIATLGPVRVKDVWWESDRVCFVSTDGIIRAWSLPELSRLAERSLFQEPIVDIRVAPVGNRCIVRTNEQLICANLETGQALGSMKCEPGPGFQMTVNATGGMLATWKADTGAVVYSLPSFTRIFGIKDGVAFHRPWVNEAGNLAGLVTEGGRVQLYQLPGGALALERQVVPLELVASDPHAPDDPWNLSVSGSGDLLAIGRRRRVSVARAEEAQATPPILATVGNLVETSFSSSSRWMLTCSNQDSRVRVWRTSDWTEIMSLPNHTGGAAAMSVSPDEKYIVTVDKEGVVRLWSGPEMEWKRNLPESAVAPHDFAIDPASNKLWAACTDGTVARWSLDASAPPHIVRDDPKASYTVAFSSKLGVLASAGELGRIRLTQSNGESLPEIEVEPGSRVTNLRFSPDDRYLAASARFSPVVIYDTRSWTRLKAIELKIGRLATVRWSSDGTMLAVSGSDGSCQLLRAPTFESIACWKAHQGACRDAVFAGNGAVLATGGDDGVVRLWETRGWKPAGEVSIGKDNIFCLAFHPDGNMLAVGDRSGRVTQVGVSKFKALASFVAGSPVMAVEFVGPKLVVGTIDLPISIWDFGMLARCVRDDGRYWKQKLEGTSEKP